MDSLTDYTAKARVMVRMERVGLGNLGDSKAVGEGICELRIDVGPGYRVYFGQDGPSIIILLCGGSKATQGKDIEDAKRYWRDFRSQKSGAKRTLR